MTEMTIERYWKPTKLLPFVKARQEGFFLVDGELIEIDFREHKIVSVSNSRTSIASWSGSNRRRQKPIFGKGKPDIADGFFSIADGRSSIRLHQPRTNKYEFTVSCEADLNAKFWLAETVVKMDVGDRIRVSISCSDKNPGLVWEPVTIEFDDPNLITLCKALGVLVTWIALDLIHDVGSHA